MQRRSVPAGLAIAWVIALAPTAQGAGLAHSPSFIILAPDQPLADALLAKAEHYRQRVAREWLGEALPPQAGRTALHVELSENEDRGLTWSQDTPDRQLHNIWLTTTRQRALGSMLAHEVCHVVMATRFPERLPCWIDEGIASRYDDPRRVALRQRAVGQLLQRETWPDFETLLTAERIAASDQTSYAVAASVTEYLLARADRATLLRFAETANASGWNVALRDSYGIADIDRLQAAWQAWVVETPSFLTHAETEPSEPGLASHVVGHTKGRRLAGRAADRLRIPR